MGVGGSRSRDLATLAVAWTASGAGLVIAVAPGLIWTVWDEALPRGVLRILMAIAPIALGMAGLIAAGRLLGRGMAARWAVLVPMGMGTIALWLGALLLVIALGDGWLS